MNQRRFDIGGSIIMLSQDIKRINEKREYP